MESPAIAQNMRKLLDSYQNLRGKRCNESGCATVMWNAVVITTADEAQCQAFEQQIRDKHKRQELPLDLPVHVVADPPGPRIGNGGSTLTALEFLHSVFGDSLYQQKILLIHAGGWSQRMPSATILGKIFSAIPHGQPIYQMLDLKLAMYLPLLPRLSPGIFLVCADDFLVYDLGEDDSWTIPGSGFTALAHPSPISVGRSHGVYVVDGAEKVDTKRAVVVAKCLEVLQKPSDDRMKDRGALLKSDNGSLEFCDGITLEGEVVYTDSCFYFGVDVVKRLLQLKKEMSVISCEIDAYGDFLQALGPNATDGYIFNTSNISQMTSDLTQVRKQVFAAMRSCDIHLLLLNASKFIHIGTTRELITHFCQDMDFQSQMSLEKDVFNCWQSGEEKVKENDGVSQRNCSEGLIALGDDKYVQNFAEKSCGCVMHSVMLHSSSVSPTSVVEYCQFDVPITVQGGSIVSNCQWLQAESEDHTLESLVLPENTFLHTVSVLHQGASAYVTIFFNISDNLKTSTAVSSLRSLPFLNTTLGAALKQWQLSDKAVSPQDAGSEVKVSLWSLKLYPGATTMTESLSLALDMVDSVQNQRHLSTPLTPGRQVFSLADALAQKDVTTMLNFRRRLFDLIQSSKAQMESS
ncbi:fucose-1-phosphate guanylyltransferase-like [Littorina saxatilis]|uniref:GDP-fucose pyrophosphorylase domain-containing protein n=1 Tax=Littorina saxatilis TaxID=31220 RepID=A0AAN9B2H3_9CAEN